MSVAPDGDHERHYYGARPGTGGHTAGYLLHERRLEYGWDLDDIAAALKIRREYLEALENDHVSALPGAAYAVGFMRAYGDFLGFDGKEIADLFKQQKSVVARTPELTFPIPLTERGIPGSSVIMVALIVCVLGYGAWAWYNSGPRTSLAAVQPVPARLLPPADIDPPSVTPNAPAAAETHPPPEPIPQSPGLQASSPSQSLPSSALPPGTGLPPGSPLAPSTVAISRGGQTVTQPLTTASTPLPVTPADSTTDQPHVFGGSVPGHVVVKATADCWVEVLDDGHQIWTRTLKAGDVYYPPKDGLVMRTGNAGGLVFSIDGRMLPPLGASGEVKRIALDPSKLTGG